jgi:sulfur carrier protein ThiS
MRTGGGLRVAVDHALTSAGTTGPRQVHMTLKLYASLTKYLPEAFQKNHAMPMVVDANATIETIIAPLGMPPALVKLVVLNGIFVPPSERAETHFVDDDVLAIWPPVAGG